MTTFRLLLSLSPTLPTRRIRRLTEHAKAMLEDELSEGPGDLLSDESFRESQGIVPSSEDSKRLTLRIQVHQLGKTAVNKFGLVRTYHGHPSGVPKSQKLDFLTDNLQPTQDSLAPPNPLLKKKSVKDIIHPYPNISSFLFNR